MSFASGQRKILIPFCHPCDLWIHKIPHAFISRVATSTIRPDIRDSAAFVATKLYSGLSDDVSVLSAWCGAALTANTRRFLISPRRFVPAIHERKKNVHHLTARRERKKESEVKNDAFAASLRCFFLLAFAVHKTTREVARNQQPSLSR